MIKGVLFDLGNTLVEYFPKWEPVLRESITEVHAVLSESGLRAQSIDDLWPRVQAERGEVRNYRVRPLHQRLQRIFGIRFTHEQVDMVSRAFMKPIFALGKCYPDAAPVVEEIRSFGLKTAIVSNTPWGSPSYLWREEINRLGLHDAVDEVVFCADIGWRKPARPIFLHTCEKLGLSPQDCLFVGDDPRWDLVGPHRVGMRAVVISRDGIKPEVKAEQITALDELFPLLK